VHGVAERGEERVGGLVEPAPRRADHPRVATDHLDAAVVAVLVRDEREVGLDANCQPRAMSGLMSPNGSMKTRVPALVSANADCPYQRTCTASG
jgi:hypothetical protein